MIPYWLLFLAVAGMALQRRFLSKRGWIGFIILSTIFIGLRYRVGGDWGSYGAILERVSDLSIVEILTDDDPAYYLLSKISDALVGDVWLVNLVAGLIFSAGLVRFCRSLPDPLIALTAAIPYMLTVLAMGYTRQAVAFGLLLWALVYLRQERTLAFSLTIALAATFHMSAVILLPLAAVSRTQNRAWTAAWVALSTGLLYWLFLQEQSTELWQNYVVSDYGQSSEGGPIRVAMNAVPALVFLGFRRRFVMPKAERKLWFWVSVGSLASLPLVFQAPTAVDRVALYFMPIQLVVYGHLAFRFHHDNRPYIRAAMVGVYGLVMFVWLNYAQHAGSWLPYQFWPLA